MQRLSAKMTPNEFLAWEREQPTRHHYVRGEIFDMAGGSARHNVLAYETFGAGATLTLTHPNVTLSLDALYAGVFDLPGDEATPVA